MSEIGYNPAKTGFSRVFLIEGRARPDHEPGYKSCLMAGSPSQSFGEPERIECPDPDRYGNFIEVGSVEGAIERGALPLSGRYASDLASDLLRIAKKRCDVDVQVHFGACSDPRAFNIFTKAVIVEKARLTNWGADDLGALGSDANAAINENADVSFDELYEVLPMTFTEKAKSVVTNPLIDVVICDAASCGECDDESDGCQKIYAISLSSAGSPGTPPDVIFSLDKGQNWAADNIETMSPSDAADGIACVDGYIVVISEDTESHHFKAQSLVDNGTVDQWQEVTTGYVATKGPLDIWSVGVYAFIVGEGGYVYGTSEPDTSVTVLDAGVATTQNLNAVHALSDLFAVAVGDSDTIIYTKDRLTWVDATATGGGNNLTCVWCKSKTEWWVGDDGGQMWYTLDGGVTWTEKDLPGTGWDIIKDISFPTDSVGFISASKATPRGYMLRSYDGGYSWVILPEGVGSLPLADHIHAHAACTEDANFVVGVGLADDGTDGILVVGND